LTRWQFIEPEKIGKKEMKKVSETNKNKNKNIKDI
jgi:hypothetical protein